MALALAFGIGVGNWKGERRELGDGGGEGEQAGKYNKALALATVSLADGDLRKTARNQRNNLFHPGFRFGSDSPPSLFGFGLACLKKMVWHRRTVGEFLSLPFKVGGIFFFLRVSQTAHLLIHLFRSNQLNLHLSRLFFLAVVSRAGSKSEKRIVSTVGVEPVEHLETSRLPLRGPLRR